MEKNANIRNITAAKNTYLTARKNEENSIEERRKDRRKKVKKTKKTTNFAKIIESSFVGSYYRNLFMSVSKGKNRVSGFKLIKKLYLFLISQPR